MLNSSERYALPLLAQIIVGIMTIVFASGLSWIGWTVSETQTKQSSANARAEERWDAVLFRLRAIESKISSQYSQEEARRTHERMNQAIDHTWQAHEKLKTRVDELDRRR